MSDGVKSIQKQYTLNARVSFMDQLMDHLTDAPAGNRLHYSFRLFIAGKNTRSESTIKNLERLCALIDAPCEIEVVDVLEQPSVAERERILGTPTLVKLVPLPSVRLIGDLNDLERVLAVLEAPRKAEARE